MRFWSSAHIDFINENLLSVTAKQTININIISAITTPYVQDHKSSWNHLKDLSYTPPPSSIRRLCLLIVSGQRFTRGAVLARPWPMPNTKYPLARTHKQKCVNSQDTHGKCAPPHRPTTTPPHRPPPPPKWGFLGERNLPRPDKQLTRLLQIFIEKY